MPKTSETAATELSVIARAPFEVYYEGPAVVVSAKNKVGNFDILPGHSDFFSLLEPCEVAVRKSLDEEPIYFTIQSGIMTVRDNEVLLFADM